MFRVLSTRRSRRGRGYEQLGDGHGDGDALLLPHQLSRAKSLPASSKNLSSQTETEQIKKVKAKAKATATSTASKILPLFSLFETKRKKRATAKPEFSRYMEYVKEGGVWDIKSNMPVIYYK